MSIDTHPKNSTPDAPMVIGPQDELSWNAARASGLLWYINQYLQNIGLSVFLQAPDILPDGTLEEPVHAVLGRNPCRGFEDDDPERKAFSKWLAENAARNHRDAFPYQKWTAIEDQDAVESD